MAKYSYKEKKSHFNALRNADSASVDLEFLLKLCPEHPDKRRFTLYAKKLGDEILLSLLDYATKEEIREFRRKKSEPEPKPELQPEVPSPEPEPRPESLVKSGTVTDDSEHLIAEAEQRAAEAEERADDAELRAEEAEEKVEEAEQRAEEAEERAEQAKQALEEEKKKERPAKSKRKKSSPK
jgi:hypothetical protein